LKSLTPRKTDHAHNSANDPPDRKPACSIGEIPLFAILMLTCWRPQQAHRAKRITTALTSNWVCCSLVPVPPLPTPAAEFLASFAPGHMLMCPPNLKTPEGRPCEIASHHACLENGDDGAALTRRDGKPDDCGDRPKAVRNGWIPSATSFTAEASRGREIRLVATATIGATGGRKESR